MLDFDKLFEEYVIGWYKLHADEFDDANEMEDVMPKLYDEWSSTPCDTLNGKSPLQYFDEFNSNQLIDMLIQSCEGDNNPCSLLLDKISNTLECGKLLSDIIETSDNTVLVMLAVNILVEQGASHPLSKYVQWLNDSSIDDGLRELGVEVLCENSNAISGQLFSLLENKLSIKVKTLIAEILINADKDDRTYNLLCELFAAGDNLPLYAGYIGKYGDERASGMLYRALDTCNYHEYIEIKNAIERMGGVVEIERDFTDDATFRAIKNIK